MIQKPKTLPHVTKIDPFWEAKKPGMLRARIEIKKQFLDQCHPASQEWWRVNQQLAELEQSLHEVESKI